MHRAVESVFPCRVGLGQLKNLITDVLDGKANIRTLTEIQETAKSIMNLQTVRLAGGSQHGIQRSHWI